jgi:integral membrane sensor domain MASE1
MDAVGPNYLRLLLLLAPVFLISLALAVYALIDLARRTHVRGPRGLWAGLLFISAFAVPTGIIISGLYLAWGRHPEAANDSD